MVFLLSDSLFQMFQFLTRALDLVARGFQLLAVHQRPGARKPAAGPPGDRQDHLQIPHQFHGRRSVGWRLASSVLRF